MNSYYSHQNRIQKDLPITSRPTISIRQTLFLSGLAFAAGVSITIGILGML